MLYLWRSSQVVRQWSATPVSTGSNPVCASLKNPENLEFSGFFTIPIFLIHSVRPMPLFFFYILSIVSIFDSLYVKLKYTEYNCENGK